MSKFLKLFMLIVPLSFTLLSATEDESLVARGGGGGGHVGGAGGGGGHVGGYDAGRAGNYNHDGYRGGYGYDGYGGYGGYGGAYYNGGLYGPALLPNTQDPNDDVNAIYNRNLRNMEQTGH